MLIMGRVPEISCVQTQYSFLTKCLAFTCFYAVLLSTGMIVLIAETESQCVHDAAYKCCLCDMNEASTPPATDRLYN